MNMQLVNEITKSQIKTDVPQFKAGDTLKVFVKIQEGNKTRLQMFEGVCIAKKGCGIGETFTVRKISYGVGVEKTSLIHSPLVEKVEVVRVGKARRAKLYYLRERTGKASKTKEMVGARIENKMITVKEEVAEAPAKEAEVATEETKTEATAE